MYYYFERKDSLLRSEISNVHYKQKDPYDELAHFVLRFCLLETIPTAESLKASFRLPIFMAQGILNHLSVRGYIDPQGKPTDLGLRFISEGPPWELQIRSGEFFFSSMPRFVFETRFIGPRKYSGCTYPPDLAIGSLLSEPDEIKKHYGIPVEYLGTSAKFREVISKVEEETVITYAQPNSENGRFSVFVEKSAPHFRQRVPDENPDIEKVNEELGNIDPASELKRYFLSRLGGSQGTIDSTQKEEKQYGILSFDGFSQDGTKKIISLLQEIGMELRDLLSGAFWVSIPVKSSFKREWTLHYQIKLKCGAKNATNLFLAHLASILGSLVSDLTTVNTIIRDIHNQFTKKIINFPQPTRKAIQDYFWVSGRFDLAYLMTYEVDM